MLRNIETDSVTNKFTDLDGIAKINLSKGNYKLEVLTFRYDTFEFLFKTNDNEYIELKFNLGLAAEEAVYQINSKRTLSEIEINEIMDCVKNNR